MQIRKFISRLLICITCIFCLTCVSFADENISITEINEPAISINKENTKAFNAGLSKDLNSFESGFETNLKSSNFVPIEARIGLVFMRALSSIDYVLQISLVRFSIMFLFVMYAFWIALEAYKTIRESTDYKTVIYDVFKKGFIIVVWVIVLEFGPAKIFGLIIGPIISIGTYLSDFILNAVGQTYNVYIPDTCNAIHNYVNANGGEKLLTDADTVANIMCLPGRISVYFYHAISAAWKWMVYGFGHSATAVIVGAICIVIFIKCIFKYAFMTLGIVSDLFLTLLMLPFTAIAEAAPTTSEKNYPGQILNGFLKAFNTKKLSDIISIFINVAIYFVSLSIIIAICAALLTNIISVNGNNTYAIGSVMTTILCGCLILYLANQADSLAGKIGGKIDNSFGKQMEKDAKQLWDDVKKNGKKIYDAWAKKK